MQQFVVVTDREILELRNEIARLVAAARQSDLDHATRIAKSDELHATELVALADVMAGEAETLKAEHVADVDHLKQALETRDLIGQAKGVLMATLGCTADEAFAVLVKQSQHEHRKLAEVATEIAARASRRRQ